jgi:hypothetical protein
LALLATTTRLVGILQMVFINPIMIIHVKRIVDRPSMSLMVVGGYRSENVVHPKRGYREPIDVIALIFYHRDGHYVRSNKVLLKYIDFKKKIYPNAHVRMFNFIVKSNVETSEEYIINVFSYTLKNTTLEWCHNYTSKFPNYVFLELTQAFCKCHQKIQNDEKIYMELKNMKKKETKKVEVYYE